MKKSGLLLLLLMPFWAIASSSKSILSETHLPMNSKNNQQGLIFHNQAFMTSADIDSATLSNVSIQNTSTAPIAVTGIYVSNLSSTPTDCTANTLYDSSSDPYGALWAQKVTIAQNDTSYIGANYLYNMMMIALYIAKIKGHTEELYTPGDYGEDHQNHWCIYLGVTDQTVGSGSLTSSIGSLESANILAQWISPADPLISFTNITCHDSTRTCSTTDSIPPQPFPHQIP